MSWMNNDSGEFITWGDGLDYLQSDQQQAMQQAQQQAYYQQQLAQQQAQQQMETYEAPSLSEEEQQYIDAYSRMNKPNMTI